MLLRGNKERGGEGANNVKRQSSLEIITMGGDVNVKATKKKKKWQQLKEKQNKKKEFIQAHSLLLLSRFSPFQALKSETPRLGECFHSHR